MQVEPFKTSTPDGG